MAVTRTTGPGFAVADFGRLGLIHFDPNGAIQSEQKVDALTPSDRIEVIDDGLVHTATSVAGSGDSVRLSLRYQRGATAVDLVSRVDPRGSPISFTSCPISQIMSPIFAPELRWAALGDRVVVSGSPEYVISVYEGGRLVTSVRRDLPARDATEALARAEIGDSLSLRAGDRRCRIGAGEVVAKRGVAPVIPAVQRLGLAPDGTIWAVRGTVRGEPTIIDVFARDGQYLGTLPPGTPPPVDFLSNGDIVAIETDSLSGADVVRVYRAGPSG
jgi:hypothetical protein